LANQLVNRPLTITDVQNFCFFVFYEDESEQSECMAKHEKGYFVIKKSLKHCLFHSATVHVTASWCVFARKICCLQTR